MGWGVRDYPSAPREAAHWRCQAHGCEIYEEQEIYCCTAKGCGEALLCVGCIWQCADCGEDFCEAHIVDATKTAPFTTYVCHACLELRYETQAS
jgi:hypothetical protein